MRRMKERTDAQQDESSSRERGSCGSLGFTAQGPFFNGCVEAAATAVAAMRVLCERNVAVRAMAVAGVVVGSE